MTNCMCTVRLQHQDQHQDQHQHQHPIITTGHQHNRRELKQIKPHRELKQTSLQQDLLQQEDQLQLPKTMTGYRHLEQVRRTTNLHQGLRQTSLHQGQLLLREADNPISLPERVSTAQHKINREYQTERRLKQQGKFKELKAIILTRNNNKNNDNVVHLHHHREEGSFITFIKNPHSKHF